jgi:hypothetical protein
MRVTSRRRASDDSRAFVLSDFASEKLHIVVKVRAPERLEDGDGRLAAIDRQAKNHPKSLFSNQGDRRCQMPLVAIFATAFGKASAR